ncbi:hypothetical protein A3K87_26015 [Variovorax paradoxus]|uniref:Uncharacterized protein n=1 Tax=Variovorax paradoxus TaxID=34073 RepID=A0AA91DK16_VARPD|nr:hypothetical protein [Variovorax paradoxus]OAK59497.1 hypothetical protein A3K87_26015 [Variovorax paradoxus]
MSNTTDIVSAFGSGISAIAACVAAIGVWYAKDQLKTSRELAQLSFEDALAKEYRELAGQLSKKALMGESLTDTEYEDAFDELYRYVDLTNEQISLRARGRITPEVWCSWLEGIKSNLALPAFARAWAEIKERSSGFEELRHLEQDSFSTDPKKWR